MVRSAYAKKLIYTLIIALVLLSANNTQYVNAQAFNIEDPITSIPYSIIQKDHRVFISSSTVSFELPIADEVIDVVCFDSIFSFLCLSKNSPNSYLYSLRSYNLISKELREYATNYEAKRNTVAFSSDNEAYYILDNDCTTIHIIIESDTFDITAPSVVYQLLYIGNGETLVFTGTGTFVIKSNKLSFASALCPACPCRYNSDGIIADTQGTEYLYSENKFSEITQNDTSDPTLPSNSDIIITDEIITVPHGTTVAALRKHLKISKTEFSVLKANGNTVDSGKLGSGMTVKFSNQCMTIIVIGDLTCEGNINSRDLKVLMKHLTDEALLDDPFDLSADIYKDEHIDTKDLLALSKLY